MQRAQQHQVGAAAIAQAEGAQRAVALGAELLPLLESRDCALAMREPVITCAGLCGTPIPAPSLELFCDWCHPIQFELFADNCTPGCDCLPALEAA